MLIKKRILTKEEVKLLEFIHSNIRIEMGSKSVTTSKGVPQGLTTSPLLFDIYVEQLLENMQRRNIFCRMYADDQVCLVEGRDEAIKAIEGIKADTKMLKLTVNIKKSGVLIMKRREEQRNDERKEEGDTIGGFPVVR
jgi:retron-type reverse transcriptase